MATLESITVGSLVDGISVGETVEVVAVKWHGSGVLEVTFKNAKGLLGSQLIYRENEGDVIVKENHLPWSFDANGNDMRLASEAYRINLAHIFDPYLAVHTSAVEPLPHQISAVYGEMLPRLPLRYILADDPGAGKTIMTGLLLKELIIRGDLKRCLIVSPGSLSEQWQDELYNKFHLKFEILTNDRIESAVGGNVFAETNLCIVRLDKLARNDALQEKLRVTEWDLIVVDEAHKMSATVFGGEIHYTKRFQLGRLLSGITRHFLLLTATPHNGKNEDFQLFMSLIDPDRFEGAQRTSNQSIDVSDVMRRLVKEELLKFDGTPLFPERRAYTVNYDLSPKEAVLYQEVTAYVQEEFNRADNLESMTQQLNQMINQVYKIQLEKKTAELSALQAKINPHFLYNALSSMKWMAIQAENDDISNATGLLATFYRTSLNNGSPITVVSNELENIRAYIELQRYMHGRPFEAAYDIDEGALPLRMPNFLLHPLVENAFKHGLDYVEEGQTGKLEVICQLDGERLVFCVKNNGPHIPLETLESVLTKPGRGYGLYNIQERIRLYYEQEDTGLSASVDELGNTCFWIRIGTDCTDVEDINS